MSDNEDAQVPVATKRDRKGIYLLPNLFTTIVFRVLRCRCRYDSDFENAAIAIFVAMVLDGLDGRVRMTNTQSDFGAEYDSLADMVSFGVAPALVAFSWALQDLGKVGWVATFVYCAGAALRLALSSLAVADKNYFTGLLAVWQQSLLEISGSSPSRARRG